MLQSKSSGHDDERSNQQGSSRKHRHRKISIILNQLPADRAPKKSTVVPKWSALSGFERAKLEDNLRKGDRSHDHTDSLSGVLRFDY